MGNNAENILKRIAVMDLLQSFMNQLNDKMSACDSQEEKTFIQECTLSFLIMSIKWMLHGLNAEQIENIADFVYQTLIDLNTEGEG